MLSTHSNIQSLAGQAVIFAQERPSCLGSSPGRQSMRVSRVATAHRAASMKRAPSRFGQSRGDQRETQEMLLLVAFRIAGSRPTPTASSRAVGALVLQLVGMVSFSEFFRIERAATPLPLALQPSPVRLQETSNQRPTTNDQRPVTASPVHHDGTGAGPRPSYGCGSIPLRHPRA